MGTFGGITCIREKRQFPRVKAAIQGELRRDGQSVMRIETSDIRPGGFYVEMRLTLEVGTRLDVILWLEGGKMTIPSIVVTKDPQVGNGIKFLELPEADGRRLRSVLMPLVEEGVELPPA